MVFASSALVIAAALFGSIALVVGTSSVPVSAQVLAVMHAQSARGLRSRRPISCTEGSGVRGLGRYVCDRYRAIRDHGLRHHPCVPLDSRCPRSRAVLGRRPRPAAGNRARSRAPTSTNFDVVVEDAATGYPIEQWSGYSPDIHPGASDLSTIASSLTPPSKAFSSPGLIAANAGITVGAILFVTFPSQIFNRTFEEVYDDLPRLVRAQGPRLRRFRTKLESNPSARRDELVFVATMLAGSLLGALLDQGFGFNVRALAGFAAMVLALRGRCGDTRRGRDGVQAAARHKEAVFRLHTSPAGIAVAAVCVLVSRLCDFRPGYLYGIVCGVVFGRGAREAARSHCCALLARHSRSQRRSVVPRGSRCSRTRATWTPTWGTCSQTTSLRLHSCQDLSGASSAFSRCGSFRGETWRVGTGVSGSGCSLPPSSCSCR